MLHSLIADLSSFQLLAELPSTGGYFSPPKIIVYALAMILWAHNTAWVQKDTKKIRVSPAAWIYSIYGTGLFCLLIWFILNLYWVGFGIYAAVYGTIIIIYVVYRNRRVSPAQTVLTPAHLQRLMSGSSKKQSDDAAHAKDKTRIRNFEDKVVPWPTDALEHVAHQALQDLLFDAIWRRASDIRLDFAPEQPIKVIYKFS